MRSMRPDSIKVPITIGHEGVGIISSIHPSVRKNHDASHLSVGDRIGMFYIDDACFECEGCAIHGTFCNNPSNGGAKIQGLQKDGFFAEYAVIDWRNAVKLTTEYDLPMLRMSPFFCAGVTGELCLELDHPFLQQARGSLAEVLVAFHAIAKCGLKPGQWIAIVGCGGLGQLAIRYAKAMGLKVVALDISDAVLELVQGHDQSAVPDTAFNPISSPDLVKRIRKLTGLRGVHAAAVFSDSTAAYATAQRILTYKGILMVVGMPTKDLSFSPMTLSLGLIEVRGASNGTVGEVARALDFTARHEIIPEVDFRRLEDMPQMWEEMETGRAKRRMVVLFQDSADLQPQELHDGTHSGGSKL